MWQMTSPLKINPNSNLARFFVYWTGFFFFSHLCDLSLLEIPSPKEKGMGKDVGGIGLLVPF